MDRSPPNLPLVGSGAQATEVGSRRSISIVIPSYNEEGNIAASIREVFDWANRTGRPFEILVVDDGSKDNGPAEARAEAAGLAGVRVLELMRNYGQTQAYQAGLDASNGDLVILHSADRECPVEVLDEVLRALDAGADFVNTCRLGRWGSGRRRKSQVANRLLNAISGININDRGSGTKGMVRPLAKALRLQGEWHRFIPDLASMYTARIVEIDTPFRDRSQGQSSYHRKMRSVPVILDLLTLAFLLFSRRKPFAMLPGRMFGFTGVVMGTIGGAVSLVLIFERVVFGMPLADRPLFLLSTVLALLGVIMVMLGMLGELILRISLQTGPNSYVVRPSRDRASGIRSD